MFGQNPIRKRETNREALSVESIFYTIQGEGPYGGCPAIFIRLAGCNLACTFCDTQFETQANIYRTVEHIIDEVVSKTPPTFSKPIIVVTGGEPFRQDFSLLTRRLLDLGYPIVQIETAGTLWQDGFEEFFGVLSSERDRVVIVCSPKTPRVHPKIMVHCRHWKYVVKAGQVDADGIPNYDTQSKEPRQVMLARPPSLVDGLMGDPLDTIWLSPCDEYDKDKNWENWNAVKELSLKHGHRISLQLHKLLMVE